MSNGEHIILGKGSYGQVVKIGDSAVKTFSKCNHLIQEYAAGIYLFQYDNIVKVYDCDLKNKTMRMELFKGSLRNWISEKRTAPQKMVMLREILLGLICIHDLGLVHGDLKPGNVVANWDSKTGDLTKVAIADLGFVAPSHHSKADRTAPIYREKDVEKDFRHDIYSFGIICLESLGNCKLEKQVTCQEVSKLVEAEIEDDKIKNLTLLMVNEDRMKRPTARKIIWDLYELEPPEKDHPGLPIITQRLSNEENESIKKFFKKYRQRGGFSNKETGTEKHDEIIIMRCKLGYEAITSFISIQGIPKSNHLLYSACMLYILSSMFGKTSLSIEYISEITSRNKDVIYKVLYELLASEIISLHLFY